MAGVVQRVLVGIDDSEHSQPALQFALRHASLRQLPLTVLHAAPGSLAHGSSPGVDEEHLHLAQAMAGVREALLEATGHEREGYVPNVVYTCGALLHAGRRMNLIVVGAHHGRTVSDILLGSVVAPVVERAGCPVAVVPDSPHAEPAWRTP